MNNINDLLDATLDDLEDLPEFAVLPPGAHRCYASLGIKEINDKQCVELKLKLIEHLELANPAEDSALPEGSESSMVFMLDNEFGRGNLKKIAKPIAAALGTSSLKDTIEQCKHMEVAVITTQRKDKKDPDRVYLNVKELQVA